MNYKTILCAIVFALLPTASHAFEVISSNVTPLGGDAYLYTLTYEYGYLNGTTTMPIVAGQRSGNRPELTLAFEPAAPGATSASIVLSGDAGIVDGYYQVPAGERAQFTLVSIYRHGLSRIALPRLEVTNLSHLVETDSFTRFIELSDEQRALYRVTPE
jgi:hypothetical protein